jgi:hypothetical protein
MSQNQTLTFSKVDHCPACQRKLCKRVNINGVDLVEFRHKGAEIHSVELMVKCIGCGRKYIVSAIGGIIDEV